MTSSASTRSLDLASRPPAGGRVEWAITSRCDLRCRHCYARRPRGQQLDAGQALLAADRLACSGVEAVALSGGEPTLRRDWPAIVERLAAGGVVTRMISNGQSVDRRVARRALDAGLDLLWLSLDGLEASHDHIRRSRGAFSRVLRAAAAASAVGLPFGFMTTVLRPNGQDLPHLSRLAGERGAAHWQVWLGVPQSSSALWLPPAEHGPLLDQLLELQRTDPRLALGDNVAGYLAGSACCEAGKRVLGLMSDGSVQGCLALPGPAASATLLDAPLADLWRLAAPRRARGQAGQTSNSCLAMGRALASTYSGERHVEPLGRAAAWASTLLLASSLSLGCPAKQPRPAPADPGPPPANTVEAPPKTSGSLPGATPTPTKNTKEEPPKAPGVLPKVKKLGPMKNIRPCMLSHVGCLDDLPSPPKKKP